MATGMVVGASLTAHHKKCQNNDIQIEGGLIFSSEIFFGLSI